MAKLEINELIGKNESTSKSWFCLDLMGFLCGADWDTFNFSFQEAKKGNCPFKDICNRYKNTLKKRGHQLNLFSNDSYRI